jgi:hypothetical protein
MVVDGEGVLVSQETLAAVGTFFEREVTYRWFNKNFILCKGSSRTRAHSNAHAGGHENRRSGRLGGSQVSLDSRVPLARPAEDKPDGLPPNFADLRAPTLSSPEVAETTPTALELSRVTAALLEAEEEIKRLKRYVALCERSLSDHPPFRIPFAGESDPWSPDSVLSHCFGALLPCVGTEGATTLRLVCREFKSAVADFPWEDKTSVIRGSVAA